MGCFFYLCLNLISEKLIVANTAFAEKIRTQQTYGHVVASSQK